MGISIRTSLLLLMYSVLLLVGCKSNEGYRTFYLAVQSRDIVTIREICTSRGYEKFQERYGDLSEAKNRENFCRAIESSYEAPVFDYATDSILYVYSQRANRVNSGSTLVFSRINGEWKCSDYRLGN